MRHRLINFICREASSPLRNTDFHVQQYPKTREVKGKTAIYFVQLRKKRCALSFKSTRKVNRGSRKSMSQLFFRDGMQNKI